MSDSSPFSHNLLGLKFMKRNQEALHRAELEKERQQEDIKARWKSTSSGNHTAKHASDVAVEIVQSYAEFEDATPVGRFSFNQFNPEVETLMAAARRAAHRQPNKPKKIKKEPESVKPEPADIPEEDLRDWQKKMQAKRTSSSSTVTAIEKAGEAKRGQSHNEPDHCEEEQKDAKQAKIEHDAEEENTPTPPNKSMNNKSNKKGKKHNNNNNNNNRKAVLGRGKKPDRKPNGSSQGPSQGPTSNGDASSSQPKVQPLSRRKKINLKRQQAVQRRKQMMQQLKQQIRKK